MPTPWPKPAPRIVKRLAASAVAGAQASITPATLRMRRFRVIVRAGRSPKVAGHGPWPEVAKGKGGLVAERKASDLFVECLEAEGVRFVFGIPGEETLDLNESLEDSSIAFVPVRHEQAGAYMADMYGRLTRRAGVCLGTLGPGATNLVTAVADAFLDRSPLVALTGQADLERMHKESHQYIDVVDMLRPLTKWNAQLTAPEIIPEVVRKAFKVAQEQKPGPTHIELPEDVMAEEVGADPLPVRTARRRPEPSGEELLAAVELIRRAGKPEIGR